MNKLITLLTLVLLTTACGSKTSGSRDRQFDINKAITFNENEPFNSYAIIDGEQMVFKYSYNHPQDDNISDDELTEIFVFTVSSGKSSFKFTTDNIADDPALSMAYSRLCFCGYNENFRPVAFSASGTKISTTKWEVKFDVTFKSGEFEYSLSDEGVYYKSSF